MFQGTGDKRKSRNAEKPSKIEICWIRYCIFADKYGSIKSKHNNTEDIINNIGLFLPNFFLTRRFKNAKNKQDKINIGKKGRERKSIKAANPKPTIIADDCGFFSKNPKPIEMKRIDAGMM